MVIPPVTIAGRPHAVLGFLLLDSPLLPSHHNVTLEHIARLIVASRSTLWPIRQIRRVGHTDSSGAAPYNQTLGLQRATV
jgi:outer membrane protein OmpA-like peptidoglycan-associated protein